MNKFKKISKIIAIAVLSGIVSCSDSFLEEHKTWTMSAEYFDTPEGLRELAAGLPQTLRLMHASEYSYAMLNYGTDEFQTGSDPSNVMWNEYNAGLQSVVSGGSSNRIQPQTAWDICYVAVNSQNIVIEKAPKVLTDPTELNSVLGEALFMRGWTYFYLVQQWGGVPIKLAPSVRLEREFARSSREETLQQALDDLQESYDRLDNPANRIQGKIYKDAAAHFLAKALLYRQSEICSDFNASTKSADLAKALQLCDEVISHRPLAPDFVDLWDFKVADGDNEKLPEVILAAQYSAAPKGANGRYGNNQCVYFISNYRFWTGFERDIAGGREFARLKNTDYVYNVYDLINDSRFWKSFRTTQAVNFPSQMVGVWAGSSVTFQIGQLGTLFVINSKDDDRFQVPAGSIIPEPTNAGQPPITRIKNKATGQYEPILCPETGVPIPNVLPRYRVQEGSVVPEYAYQGLQWPTMSKYLDGTRPDVTSTNSARDGIVARVAETYLIRAEIKLRQGDNTGALSDINIVRKRAGYKTGEDRARYVDGTQSLTTSERPYSSFYGKNSYYESNDIAVTAGATEDNMIVSDWNTLPVEDEEIIAQLGYASDFDRKMCFLLNERSRELMGEMVRWTDLSRTGTLVKRAYVFNEDVAKVGNLDDHHLVRPIPQSFLDDTWKEGRPLTGAEKQAMQNPGY